MTTQNYLTLDEKLKLIGEVENDLWVILKSREGAEYSEVSDLIGLIEKCQIIKDQLDPIMIATLERDGEGLYQEISLQKVWNR